MLSIAQVPIFSMGIDNSLGTGTSSDNNDYVYMIFFILCFLVCLYVGVVIKSNYREW